MSYVQKHLLPGERITYRAHLHKIIWVLPVLLSLLLMVGAGLALNADIPLLAAGLVGLAVLPVVWAWIDYTSSEFAVTDKRVVIKVGWIRRRTLETMLGKVEGISVDQTIAGRMLGFGTITVTGTGGTKEPFANIAKPLEFRRQVQAQVSASEDLLRTALPMNGQIAGPARDERDCPWCAERILNRARVCKHCGRDVEPLVTT
jgi:uncharacterized membrane protein YdbT with pleckstrin-like domain